MRLATDGELIDLGGRTYEGDIRIVGPARGITVQNGRVRGEIRCRASGYSDVLERWNRTPDWTKAAQEAAPHDITLRDLTVEGQGDATAGVYAGPGTTDLTIRRVNFTGRTSGPSVYLSMETARNRVLGCTFSGRPGARREVLAVDGSADNIIRNNTFNRCRYGGIYIYRNSGENGVIRHQEPRRNLITGNRFDLAGMQILRFTIDMKIPWGVFIGSRQGTRIRHNDLDAGYPWGSSASDLCYARENIVTDNQFRGDWLQRWVRDNDEDNVVAGNEFWNR